jgi:LysM repeat protein
MKTDEKGLNPGCFLSNAISVFILLQAVLAGGCSTLSGDTHNRQVQDANEMQILRQEVLALKEKVKNIEASNEMLAGKMESVGNASAKEISAIRSTATADAERLKQEITQELAPVLGKRIEEIMRGYYQPQPAQRAAGGSEHVIEAGQTLTQIARIHGVSVEALMKANNITDANTIRKGDKLIIPK